MSNVGFKPELEKQAKQEQRLVDQVSSIPSSQVEAQYSDAYAMPDMVIFVQLRAMFIGVFKSIFCPM